MKTYRYFAWVVSSHNPKDSWSVSAHDESNSTMTREEFAAKLKRAHKNIKARPMIPGRCWLRSNRETTWCFRLEEVK